MTPAYPTRPSARRIYVSVLLAVVMLMLTGCFGPKPPRPQVVSISGTVSAPPGPPASGSVAAAAAVIHEPVGGATVKAFDFATAKEVGKTATTDSVGRYTISNIPKGIDVVIKATAGAGSRNGAGMRLSTLVLGAADGADGNIDGATSLGAEAWGRHYGTGHNVAAWDFQMTLDAR